MSYLIQLIHVLALGFWSGAVLFFSFFVALPVIDQMKRLALSSGNWLNLSTEQQGSRLAGEFLNVVFARYFPFQCVCGVLALATALWWWNIPGWLSKIRVILVALALTGAVVNLMVLAPKVHELRAQRYDANPQIAEAANQAFGPAHTYSLLVDMVGLLCVIVALGLTLWLPANGRTPGPEAVPTHPQPQQ